MIELTQAAPKIEEMAKHLAEEASVRQALLTGAGRKTLVNFSNYPLPVEVRAAAEKSQGTSLIEIKFPADFDLTKPLRPQVAALIHKLEFRLRILNATSLDYVILPDLPVAAYLVAEAFTRADAQAGPGVVWLKLVEGVWVLGGIE